MKFYRAVLCVAVLTSGLHFPLFAQESKGAAGGKSDYSIGDRLPSSKSAAPSASYREITWEALVPKHWDPAKMFKGLNLDKLEDSDPRAMEALERIRQAWNDAPAEPSLNGARVRIPGFIVPLDTQRGQIKEFLLVPYFGACIHTPPPPANQIIHGIASKPIKNIQMMDAVWISGTIEVARKETEFGMSGYRMKVDLVTPYQKK